MAYTQDLYGTFKLGRFGLDTCRICNEKKELEPHHDHLADIAWKIISQPNDGGEVKKRLNESNIWMWLRFAGAVYMCHDCNIIETIWKINIPSNDIRKSFSLTPSELKFLTIIKNSSSIQNRNKVIREAVDSVYKVEEERFALQFNAVTHIAQNIVAGRQYSHPQFLWINPS